MFNRFPVHHRGLAVRLRTVAALVSVSGAACAQPGPNPSAMAPSTPTAASLATYSFVAPDENGARPALLDLRGLNEKVAGEKGFVRRSSDGNDFVLGDGTPARFWAVNTGVQRQNDEALNRQARFLARLGVNMVRMHGAFAPKKANQPLDQVDEEELERAWRLVAAMKKQGIYTTISLYWPGHDKVQEGWNLEGYGAGESPWGLLFFNPRLKEAYKAWARTTYTRINPHTGLALKDDPAVGLIQIQNEDSLFFWTTQNIKAPQLAILRSQYAAWLLRKHGSLAAARAMWKAADFPRDDWEKGLPDIDIWRMTSDGEKTLGEGAKIRISDQTEFLASVQRDFYREIGDFYREIGCKQLVNAGNWTTADNLKLGDIERYSYTANQVSGVNRYVGGTHNGPNEGWRIDPGDFYTSRSQTFDPTALPTGLKQTVGQPMIIPESTWVTPVSHGSEGPFLTAAYQSLSGVDAFYWFSADDAGYDLDPYFPYHTFPDGQKGLGKWALSPAITTQFPASALLFRKGFLRPGAVVVHEERPLGDLWKRAAPLVTEGSAYTDPNRKPDVATSSSVQSVVSPLAFLVGRVEVQYGGDPKGNRVADLSRWIDQKRRVVTSTTGEITLNYGSGLCLINAPRAQGASGELRAAGLIQLRDLSIAARNTNATILAVPLDDRPLAQSRRVLLQIGTSMRPTGWAEEPAEKTEASGRVLSGWKVLNTGTMPWQVIPIAAKISIRNPNLKKATLLDASGRAAREIKVTREGKALRIALPPDAMHLILE